MKQFSFSCVLLFAFMLSACSHLPAGGSDTLSRKDYDVSLRAVPIGAMELSGPQTVDAIDLDPEKSRKAKVVVQFLIERVLVGEFTTVQEQGLSKIEQLKEAVRNRNLLKVVTLNLDDPNQTHMKQWITIAVEDTETSFGIKSWDELEPKTFDLYLKRTAKGSKSYYFVGSKER